MANFITSSNSVTVSSYKQNSELTVTVESNNVVISIDYGENFSMNDSEFKEFQTLLGLKLKENNFNV